MESRLVVEKMYVIQIQYSFEIIFPPFCYIVVVVVVCFQVIMCVLFLFYSCLFVAVIIIRKERTDLL